MKQRIVSAVIGVALLIAVLISDSIIVNIGVAVIGFIALLEMYEAVGLTKYLPLKILGLCASFCFTFAYSFDNKLFMPTMYFYIVLLFGLYMIKSSNLALKDISKMFFLTIFVCFFLAHIVFIRKLELGQYLIWLVFVGAFMTDTFALLAGMLFGKHKLNEWLSPKKTVEGSIGGVFGAALGMVLYGYIVQTFFNLTVDFWLLAVLGTVSSVAAQVGDLAASRIKREFGVKDYGKIMPGHGGVMDRFDSVIFVAPIVYLFVSNINVIFTR